MSPRLQRAGGVWAMAFVLALVGLPLIAFVGEYLIDHPFIIVLSAVLASFLGLLELITQ